MWNRKCQVTLHSVVQLYVRDKNDLDVHAKLSYSLCIVHVHVMKTPSTVHLNMYSTHVLTALQMLLLLMLERYCVFFSSPYWFEYFWPNYAVPFFDNINSFKWQEKVNYTLNNTKLYIFKMYNVRYYIVLHYNRLPQKVRK